MNLSTTGKCAVKKRRCLLHGYAAAIILSAVLSVSCGTVRTRMKAKRRYVVYQGHDKHHECRPGAFFGKQPYQAVADDIEKMKGTEYVPVFVVVLESRPYSRLSDYIAVPFDLLLDTAFLPFDLVWWAFGFEKGWRDERVIDRDYPDELPPAKRTIRRNMVEVSRVDPERRASLISRLTTLLADPNVRRDNPLGIPDALHELIRLEALEAESTLVAYMFYDTNRGSDFRLIDGDLDVLTGRRSQSERVASHQHAPTAGSLWCVTWAGTNFVPKVLERLSQATPEEMSMDVGGGAVPFLAFKYFAALRNGGRSDSKLTPDECVRMIQSYKGCHPTMSAEQKTRLDVIIDVIEKRTWSSDDSLDSEDPGERAWAPSFATEPWPARTNYCGFKVLLRYQQATILGYTGHDRSVAIPTEAGGLPVRNIAPHAFFQRPITDVVIPGSVTNIGGYAFAYSQHLTNVVLSSGLVSIGSHAFAKCRGLDRVTIPETVERIGDFAFSGCFDRQWSIYFKGNPPTVDPAAFFSSSVAVYYSAGNTNWPASFGDKPTQEWQHGTDGSLVEWESLNSASEAQRSP